jgi:hypothetical protein
VARKDSTCPDCGSSDRVPEGGEIRTRPEVATGVPMRCEGCESASEMVLVLSPEGAKALGLHSLGGAQKKRPDVPSRYGAKFAKSFFWDVR